MGRGFASERSGVSGASESLNEDADLHFRGGEGDEARAREKWFI